MKDHTYIVRINWEGNTGTGTADYESYRRNYRVQIAGKPDLVASADPIFRGDADRHNPEDLFVAAISSCHMLTYLALCARSRISVRSYTDRAEGVLHLTRDGGGRFESVTLKPQVVVGRSEDVEKAVKLHDRAHDLCFIAASCGVPIHAVPNVSC